MTGVPAYKVRRRMRERAVFTAAVQARTQPCPAAVLGGWVVEFGAVGNHAADRPRERGGQEPCDIGGSQPGVVAVVSVAPCVRQRTDGAA